jgi:zinc and cadmium transporter
VGGLAAYALSSTFDVAYLLPFAAGNFIYIAAADLLPELAAQTRTRDKVETTAAFVTGLVILLTATRIV